jgi:hypothetical protein
MLFGLTTISSRCVGETAPPAPLKAQIDRKPRFRRALAHRDWRNQNFGKLVGDALAAGGRRAAAVERLPAPGQEASRAQYEAEARQSANATT